MEDTTTPSTYNDDDGAQGIRQPRDFTMSQTKLRAGIIGLGFNGGGDQVAGDRLGQKVADLDGHHRSALSNHLRVELVAGSSQDAGRRERFQQSTGARTYADWRQMLAAENLDIVSIASMTPNHAEQTIGCVKAGVRAIYCEKPIAATLAEAEAMVTACHRAGSLLVINHNRRFNPTYRQLSEFITDSQLGDLITVSARWATGRLGNVGTHMIDAIRMLTRREVRAVSATLDMSARPDCRGAEFRDPGGWAMLRMDGGLMGQISAPDYAKDPAEICISGSLGRAVVQGNAVRIDFWDGRGEHWPTPDSGVTSMDVAVSEIVAALDHGQPVRSTGEDGLRSLEVTIACHVSHERYAAWTELPLEQTERQRVLQAG